MHPDNSNVSKLKFDNFHIHLDKDHFIYIYLDKDKYKRYNFNIDNFCFYRNILKKNINSIIMNNFIILMNYLTFMR